MKLSLLSALDTPRRQHFLIVPAVLLLAACAATPEPVSTSAAPPPIDRTADVAPLEQRPPTEEEVMYHVWAAEYQGSEGNLAGAVDDYLEAALRSNDPEISKRATQVAFATQSWQQAAMAGDRWAYLDAENVSAQEAAALSKLMVGDYAGAEFQLNNILDLMGDSSQAWAMVSGLLAQSRNPVKADEVLNSLLANRPDVPPADAFYARSQLAARAGDLDRAFERVRRAVELEPERIEFLTWAGRIAINLNLPETALEYYRRAWRLTPQDHDLALAYADLLARSGNADAARSVMRQMVQTPDVLLSQVLFEISAKDQEAANAFYESFDEMDFESSGAHSPEEVAFYQGRAAEALGRLGEAIDLFAKVGHGEHALPATVRRAELLAMTGRLDEGRAVLSALRTQPSATVVEESWLAEARILRQAGKNEEALRIMELALKQLPMSIPLLYSKALLAAELGQVDVAEASLRLVLAEQPDNAAALNALGYTLADQTDRYEEAEALIRQAFILEPEQAAIVDSMGWVAYRRGRMVEAVQYLRRAWSLDRNAEIAAHLGEVLWVTGQQEAARTVFRDGVRVDASNPVLVSTLERLGVEL